MSQLLPCPFCGAAALPVRASDLDWLRVEVMCSECSGCAHAETEHEAILAWNRRPATEYDDDPEPGHAHINTYSGGPVWEMFGLTRANYFVAPRRVLCSMPLKWQERFVALIDEMQATLELEDAPSNYIVQVRNSAGRFESDPYGDYRHTGPVARKAQPGAVASGETDGAT